MKQRKLTNEEVGGLCLALAHLYHAGIGAGDALALLAEDAADPGDRALFSRMSRQADEGAGLARVFRQNGCFPTYVCALLEVGEQVGKSEETLNALARYYEGRARMDRQLKAALLYPSVLLLVLLAVVVILLVWVLPVFNDVYARLGSSLTGLAGGLLVMGTVLRKAMPVLCALLAAVAVFVVVLAAAPEWREKLLTAWRGKRGDKGVTRLVNAARFVQALSMGLSSGLAAHEAVDLAAGLAEGTRAFQERCQRCLSLLDAGRSLPEALRETELLSKAECRLLEAGVRGGSGEIVMEQISQHLMEESETALEAMTARIEPTLVVVMSVMVGVILLSVMLPLMHIMTAIG